MNRKTLAISTFVLAAMVASPAKATMVAGWDFSQYLAGFLSTDGATFTDTLDANYSHLDPTFGGGAESAAFGTMFIDGTFGSVDTPLDGTDPFNPLTPSLVSNVTRPDAVAGLNFNSGGACNVLVNEGQDFCNNNAMIASAATSVAFAADLASIPEAGSNWLLSFAGKTISGTATIQVEFSTNGVDFNVISTEQLTTVDTLFEVALGGTASEQGIVRLSFDVSNGLALIDNLALDADLATVPEPGVMALALSGLVGLGIYGRRRA